MQGFPNVPQLSQLLGSMIEFKLFVPIQNLHYLFASNFVFSISCCSAAADAAADDVGDISDFLLEATDDGAATSGVFSLLVSTAAFTILCLTTKFAVPSFSFFMKFQASILDIRVQSVLLTDIISSPTFNVPFLSAAPPMI